MKYGIVFPSLLLLFAVRAAAEETIEGTYSTVSESQCNLMLTLNPGGKGIFVEICRREDGSHIDDTEEMNISWQLQGKAITVHGLGPATTFVLHSSLSCEGFGKLGSRFGLIGYGKTEFWKKPIICK
jgi:hypothetical protein